MMAWGTWIFENNAIDATEEVEAIEDFSSIALITSITLIASKPRVIFSPLVQVFLESLHVLPQNDHRVCWN